MAFGHVVVVLGSFFFTLASKEVHTDAVASIGFVQKALKIAKFTGKQLFGSLFFNKVAD